MSRVLAPAFVAVAALLVMAGWMFDIDILKRLVPGFVTMKWTTALSFLFSSVILWGVSQRPGSLGPRGGLFVSASTFVILLLMSSQFLTILLGRVPYYANVLFEEGAESAVLSIAPGVPSVGTMVAFLMVAIAGLIRILRGNGGAQFAVAIAGLHGLMALVGYFLDAPGMYFYFEGVSTAMAIHTAVLFLVIGYFGVRWIRPRFPGGEANA